MKTSHRITGNRVPVTEVPAAMLCAGTTMCMGDIKIVTQSKGNCHGSRPPSGVNGSAQATSCGPPLPEKERDATGFSKVRTPRALGSTVLLASRHLGCAQRLPRHRPGGAEHRCVGRPTSKRSFRVVHSIFCLGTQRRDGRGHECCRDRLGGIQQRQQHAGFQRYAEAWIVPRSVWWLVSVNARSQERKPASRRVARGS